MAARGMIPMEGDPPEGVYLGYDNRLQVFLPLPDKYDPPWLEPPDGFVLLVSVTIILGVDEERCFLSLKEPRRADAECQRNASQFVGADGGTPVGEVLKATPIRIAEMLRYVLQGEPLIHAPVFVHEFDSGNQA